MDACKCCVVKGWSGGLPSSALPAHRLLLGRPGGVVSEWFDVHGGVRQGCGIAPLLFSIYMDSFVIRQAMA